MRVSYLTDGIDHINIYSAGRTQLGRNLSNFAICSLPTEDGYFCSVEGYWYFLCLDESCFERDKLRELYGIEAKKLGQQLADGDWPRPIYLNDFKNKIKRALRIKIEYNPIIKDMLIKSELPFDHYYNFNDKIKRPRGCKWITEEWEIIRKELKNES